MEQFVFDRVLQVDANVALAHRDAVGQRHLSVSVGRRGVHRVLNHAHLGPIAVGDDEGVAVGCEVDDDLGRSRHGRLLLGDVIAEGVASEGDDDCLLFHFLSPSIPFCKWLNRKKGDGGMRRRTFCD